VGSIEWVEYVGGLSALSEHVSWGWSLRWNVSEELFAGSRLGGGCPRFGAFKAFKLPLRARAERAY
jgi:hypothetical protein